MEQLLQPQPAMLPLVDRSRSQILGFILLCSDISNGSEGKFSLGCTATTSRGNQTVSMSWTASTGSHRI